MQATSTRLLTHLHPSDAAVVGLPLALVVLEAVTTFQPPHPSVVTTVLGVIGCLALVWWRTRPVEVLALLAVCSLVPTLGLGHEPDLYGSFIPSMIAIYAVAAYRPTRYLYVIAGFTVLVMGGFAIRAPDFRSAGQVVFNALAIVLATVIGRVLQHLRSQADTATARASLLERENDLQAREAVVAERERIARELHDVIAHDVSLMVIQAGAAQRVMRDHPDQAGEALSLIQDSGRRAVDELYLLLGMLRDDGQDLAPQRGLAAVEELVSAVRQSGVPIELLITGKRRDLGNALEVSAYRLVQEALTNVMKHARGSHTLVELAYDPAQLTLRVADEGDGPATAPAGTTGGHGLLGMRERVRMFGGSFDAGRRPGGGWLITAVLPVAADAS
ncbi:sensor histidine kinase [uncultured Jatrophihabitans sp.]|uniref:sensor histidine kinase n=1 Tax=uncultured Jatrophihabitans sp. TaxID=1610747 RepID=UPI0035CC2121